MKWKNERSDRKRDSRSTSSTSASELTSGSPRFEESEAGQGTCKPTEPNEDGPNHQQVARRQRFRRVASEEGGEVEQRSFH